jgi:hypothetical protein
MQARLIPAGWVPIGSAVPSRRQRFRPLPPIGPIPPRRISAIQPTAHARGNTHLRTIVLIIVGLLLVYLAMSRVKAPARTWAAGLLSLVWLAVVGWNLATGMSHGYSFQEELPIQIAILLPPVVLAWWLARSKQ